MSDVVNNSNIDCLQGNTTCHISPSPSVQAIYVVLPWRQSILLYYHPLFFFKLHFDSVLLSLSRTPKIINHGHFFDTYPAANLTVEQAELALPVDRKKNPISFKANYVLKRKTLFPLNSRICTIEIMTHLNFDLPLKILVMCLKDVHSILYWRIKIQRVSVLGTQKMLN